MAEGWARHLKSEVIEAWSAGIETHGLNQDAVKVMAEVGIDISHHRSKHLNEVKHIPFDWVITVCDNAIRHKGEEYFNKTFIPKFNNITIGGLLTTLVRIANKTTHWFPSATKA
jgi:protein-tyrosine-phosphatase